MDGSDRHDVVGDRLAVLVEHDQVGRAEAAAGDDQRLVVLDRRVGDRRVADDDHVGRLRDVQHLGAVDDHRDRLAAAVVAANAATLASPAKVRAAIRLSGAAVMGNASMGPPQDSALRPKPTPDMVNEGLRPAPSAAETMSR